MRLASASVIALVCVSCGGRAPAKSVPGEPGGAEDAPAGYGQPGPQPGYAGEQQPGQYPSTDSSARPLGPAGGPFAEEPPMTLDEAIVSLDQAATALSSAGTDCALACKALASMERSKARICELNGPDDPGDRCEKAKERVEAARELLGRRCGDCDT